MELIALLSKSDDEIIPNVKGALKKYTVYPLKTLEELEDLYSNIPLNLFLIDTTSNRLSNLGGFLSRLDENVVVLVGPEKLDKFQMENLPDSVYDSADIRSIRTELPLIVESALERQRFKNEIRLLKQSRTMITPAQTQVLNKMETEPLLSRNDAIAGGTVPGGRYIQEKVVVNFARMLSVSFDMRKLLDHFIDSVMEIARVSKMSVMLRDKHDFCVKTQYGLDPYIADNLKLTKDSALAAWLAKTGRIMNRPVHFMDSETININNEMEALQCVVSFPMLYKGKLIGICNIDSKITEEPFYREELEIIYVLCNYLAAAVKDIDLYHQMWYQKEFTKNILSSMSSGMIAINQEENVTIFNQQASEILTIDPQAVVGKDLRALPSPLGDILYETMMTGMSYTRYEATIHPQKLPLGINSYRLLDEKQNPVGAGIIFSDLSDSKKLEHERRRTENLEAVNDLMGKIAHEVRNPLTSIQTYIQLLNEKQTDDDLNKFYVSTVSQSVKRLDSLIDKLVSFSSTQDYNFKKEEINGLLEEAAEFVSKMMPQNHQLANHLTDKVFFIYADKKQLVKAIYYIVLCIIDRKPEGSLIEMNANTVLDSDPHVEIAISYNGDEFTKEGEQNLLKPLLDIDHLGTELNLPISHKIIEGHRGSLELKSESETSTFLIKLPIVDRRGSGVSTEGGRVSGS